tara:strand:+ start:14 stop:373 length:360 start_codon:yes stop_codon:yes gene_type:complete
MLTPAQQQAAEQRFADRNTSRVSRGLDPRTRGPFDAPPTQVQKDAIAATNFAENNADRVSRGLDPRLSRSEKDAAGVAKDAAKVVAKGVRGYAKGGSVGSASKRADGIAMKGKTKGKIV